MMTKDLSFRTDYNLPKYGVYSEYPLKHFAYTEYEMEPSCNTQYKIEGFLRILRILSHQLSGHVYTHYQKGCCSAYTQYEIGGFLRILSIKMEAFCVNSV